MKLRNIILTIALAAGFFTASAQKLSSFISKVPSGYNFWLYTPDSSPEEEVEAKPVIIFLHGASLCGNDLSRVRRYGTIDAIDRGFKPDAYVIAPQNPGGAWNPDRIMNVFDYVAENHNVDYDRIYVLGMSLGGYGTIDLCAAYPDVIAAAMAFCGGTTASNLSALNEVPLWIVHGTSDRAVNVSQSDRVVEGMKRAAGGNAPRLYYDRVPGMNHSQPSRLFYQKECYDWLFSHSLKDNGRNITNRFDISKTLSRNPYGSGKSRAKASRSKSKKAKTHASHKSKSRKSRRG